MLPDSQSRKACSGDELPSKACSPPLNPSAVRPGALRVKPYLQAHAGSRSEHWSFPAFRCEIRGSASTQEARLPDSSESHGQHWRRCRCRWGPAAAQHPKGAEHSVTRGLRLRRKQGKGNRGCGASQMQ